MPDNPALPVGEGTPRHRKRRRKSFLKRIPEKLVSKKFNLVQATLVITLAYFAYKIVIMFAEYRAPSPEG